MHKTIRKVVLGTPTKHYQTRVCRVDQATRLSRTTGEALSTVISTLQRSNGPPPIPSTWSRPWNIIFSIEFCCSCWKNAQYYLDGGGVWWGTNGDDSDEGTRRTCHRKQVFTMCPEEEDGQRGDQRRSAVPTDHTRKEEEKARNLDIRHASVRVSICCCCFPLLPWRKRRLVFVRHMPRKELKPTLPRRWPSNVTRE